MTGATVLEAAIGRRKVRYRIINRFEAEPGEMVVVNVAADRHRIGHVLGRGGNSGRLHVHFYAPSSKRWRLTRHELDGRVPIGRLEDPLDWVPPHPPREAWR